MSKIFKYIILLVITVLVITGIVLKKERSNVVANILEPVSVVSKVTAKRELKNTDGRTNILLLGVDGRSLGNVHSSSKLTDTILILSIDKEAKRPVMISIPRDLWISQYGVKINSIYPLCINEQVRKNGKDVCEKTPVTCTKPCVDRVEDTVEHVTGVPIHYYAVVGFSAFKDAIDTVGGVDVDVEEAFDDYQYPIEGKENAYPESSRYKHIHFDQGIQHLNSEDALEYARSRHSTNPNQAGDFARARRQQQVIMALKDKLLSTDVLLNPSKIKELYGSYKENVATDITIGDAMAVYDMAKSIMQDDKDNESVLGSNVVKIVLSSESKESNKLGSGLLMVPSKEERSKYNGQWVIIPKDSTFDQIHVYIQKLMFDYDDNNTDADMNSKVNVDSNTNTDDGVNTNVDLNTDPKADTKTSTE